MTRHITHTCQGTCSRQIDIELDEQGTILSVAFAGGCHGNTQGIAALVRGMRAEEAAERLGGIDCRGKGTSCPDQLSRALRAAL
ncbi:TIGR03905 family TSCPD domain-containing protein [uncultured Alistipes sp.]|uniref:TIGR03905 family TSCPD domain-containing protein n=1 Tax=uncultured Alistipes sp. TaxID=538949 RepID=UPI0025EB9026|nr:TIGR03905 family TSCPD domain-containing protein [uncultured Alistipes sp.]